MVISNGHAAGPVHGFLKQAYRITVTLASGPISLAVIALGTVYAVIWISSATCWLTTISGWLGIIAGGTTDRDCQRINKQLTEQLDFGRMKIQ